MTRRRRWRRRSTSSSPTTSPATATRALEVVRHLIAAGHDVHVVIGAPEFVFTTEIKSPNLHIRKAFLRHLRIYRGGRVKLLILDNVSGIIRPSRMTLLLGPPSSGKTTLLLALAGRLGPGLKMSGNITYNGHHLNEFVPQRTSTYVSQQDWHASEMTVRETLEFAGRCQGVGIKYDMLVELLRREKNAGIKPDEDFDVFMKAFALEGKQTSLVAEYNEAKILGLDICADTIVGDEMIKGIYGGQKKRLTTVPKGIFTHIGVVFFHRCPASTCLGIRCLEKFLGSWEI